VIGFEKDRERLEKLAKFLRADVSFYRPGIFERSWDYDCLVVMLPIGAVVRLVCPLLRGKWEDPAIVVVDKGMRYAVPILGGHHGANEVARRLEGLGLKAVITTAMEFEDGLSIGIGCRRGVEAEEILNAIRSALNEIGAEIGDVRVIATAEVKRGERGLVEAVDRIKKPLIFVKKEDIERMNVRPSKATKIGLKSVAEACALACSKRGELLLPKRVYGGVTVAIAR